MAYKTPDERRGGEVFTMLRRLEQWQRDKDDEFVLAPQVSRFIATFTAGEEMIKAFNHFKHCDIDISDIQGKVKIDFDGPWNASWCKKNYSNHLQSAYPDKELCFLYKGEEVREAA